MAATLKRLLPDVETELFRNWNDHDGAVIEANNITLCNVSGSDVEVWLSFCVLSGFFSAGLVLSQMTIPAYQTITTQITNRVILMDESIRGFASTANVVTVSLDLIGDIDQRMIPIPVDEV